MLYQKIARPLLFSLTDPEWIHQASLKLLTQTPLARALEPWAGVRDPRWERTLFGLKFPNPIGLAAGFDKNAEGVEVWERLGFGFIELGTVTPRPQAGNPLPRVFRLPTEGGLINRLGFPNIGAEAVARRLEKIRQAGRWPKIPVGINLGKNKETALEEAGRDYLIGFQRLRQWADYLVINVSSPNTPGLRTLQQRDYLEALFAPLRDEDPDAKMPLLVKIAPDLDQAQLEPIVELVEKYRLAGIVATNTTLDKTGLSLQEDGGVSGRPLTQRSTDIIRSLHRLTRGRVPIIGVGGIFNAADAQEKLDAGAALLQLYTGFVYQGPTVVRQILHELSVSSTGD